MNPQHFAHVMLRPIPIFRGFTIYFLQLSFVLATIILLFIPVCDIRIYTLIHKN